MTADEYSAAVDPLGLDTERLMVLLKKSDGAAMQNATANVIEGAPAVPIESAAMTPGSKRVPSRATRGWKRPR
jgi:hypothetical protein